MPGTKNGEPYILGIDLGVESVGWAILSSKNEGISSLREIGAHGFDAAAEGDYESGREESPAKARRDARQPRRQHWRRQWRRKKILRILQRNKLLPKGSIDTPENIHNFLCDLDRNLMKTHSDNGDEINPHLLPYYLRARALHEKLEPHTLGRAIYHLAQRRGFLSNRKTKKEDENEGVVKKSIGELQQKIDESGSSTLGEYFSTLDPEQERIRSQYTSRQMYLHEFEKIWTIQSEYHSILTDELKQGLHNAIFDQRPLKSQSHLIGHCELMPKYKRAPFALRIAQQFRLLQKVNDLLIYSPDGESRELNLDERKKLLTILSTQQDMKFTSMRSKKCLNLPRGTKFNFEEGGEKSLPGNRTDAKLSKIFDDRWPSLTQIEKDQIVEDILSFDNSDALARRAHKVWGLNKEQADDLANVTLEPGYCNHSRKALAVLVTYMEEGSSYASARKIAFPESFEAIDPIDQLPPVNDSIKHLRNPVVCRVLTELRKLINAIIREYGKPDIIRIELARDLKKSRKQRKDATKKNRENQKRREDAKRKILGDMNIEYPSRTDIEKVLLADECNWTCPYTGRSFGMHEIMGKNPQYDIEHILPMSRSLDNIYFNKTLCYNEENRKRKKNLTPFEAYSHDEQRWHEILERVRRFDGSAAKEKLRRFKLEEIPEGFTDRQLQDTRYASRLAAEYLSLLFGGRTDKNGRQRIQVSAGGVTAHLRNVWMMNSILNDGGNKTRDNHKHHAVDAIAIALAGPKIVETLAHAAENAQEPGRKLFAPIPFPWPDFIEQAREAVNKINVSRRVSRKIAGPLHAETNYSKRIPGYEIDVRHIRKELQKLTKPMINGDQIVDPVIRQIVQKKFDELGSGDPKKVFAEPENHPHVTTRDGKIIPIHKVRIKTDVNPWPVGKNASVRYVNSTPGSNHHTVIVANLDKQGNEINWKDHPVTRFEVYERRSKGLPIIKRDWGKGYRFKFSLFRGDAVIMKDTEGEKQLYRMSKISEGDNFFKLHDDARIVKEILKDKPSYIRSGGNQMLERNARKVTVSYLGMISPAHD